MKIENNKTSLTYFKNVEPVLKDDIELLKSHLGISGFGYLKMFFDNKYFFASSDSKLTDDFVRHANNTVIFCDKALPICKGYNAIVWPKATEHHSMDLYKKNNHWNGISLFKRNKNHIDLYWFASSLDDSLASDFYLDNSKLLISFVQYWRNKTRNISDFETPKELATFVDGVDFSNIDKIASAQKAEKDRIKKFSELMRKGGVNLQTSSGNVHLTAKESECLDLLSKGNTGKEVAMHLNISHRTVEVHINNVRNKTGSLYKSDLVKLYREQTIDLCNE